MVGIPTVEHVNVFLFYSRVPLEPYYNTLKNCEAVNMADEIGALKAKIEKLEGMLEWDESLDKEEKKLIMRRIIEANTTLNFYLAQQG